MHLEGTEDEPEFFSGKNATNFSASLVHHALLQYKLWKFCEVEPGHSLQHENISVLCTLQAAAS